MNESKNWGKLLRDSGSFNACVQRLRSLAILAERYSRRDRGVGWNALLDGFI